MFQRILVALDRTADDGPVFPMALTLARATGARLMLLHVLSSEEEGSPKLPTTASLRYYPTINPEILEQYQAEWTFFEEQGLTRLRHWANLAIQAGVPTEFTQSSGGPGLRICEMVTNWGADLIVMGRRKHSALSELFLGSVSNYVLHHAPCSTLVVRAGAIHNILVALDSSARSTAILAQATDLAQALGSELKLLHVLSGDEEESPQAPLSPMLEYYPFNAKALDLYQKQWQAYENYGLQMLERFQNEVEVPVTTVQLLGAPGTAIVEQSKLGDLVVLGRRGRSGLSEIFLGSVSNYVLHHAASSVLVVYTQPPVHKTISVHLPLPENDFHTQILEIAHQVDPRLTVVSVEPDLCQITFSGSENQVWVKNAWASQTFQVLKNRLVDPQPTHLEALLPVREHFLVETLRIFTQEPIQVRY